MSYHITIESIHGSILLAEGIETLSEARNAVKILFCIPGVAIESATIWNTETGLSELWGLSASGNPIRLSSSAAAVETK